MSSFGFTVGVTALSDWKTRTTRKKAKTAAVPPTVVDIIATVVPLQLRARALHYAYRLHVSGRREHLCYTDGSCKAGDAAPGGWGFVIKPPTGPTIEAYGSATETLAKAMEYRAVAEAISALPDGANAIVFSDDQSLVENLTKHLPTWRARAFARVDPRIVDSVRRIDERIADGALLVRFQWVRSHNGNAGNERADALAARGVREAKAAIATAKTGGR